MLAWASNLYIGDRVLRSRSIGEFQIREWYRAANPRIWSCCMAACEPIHGKVKFGLLRALPSHLRSLHVEQIMRLSTIAFDRIHDAHDRQH